MALWRSTKYSRMATVPIPGTTSGPGKRGSIQDFVSSLADFSLLIAISERQNTSVSLAIYPELSGTLVIISHIVVSGPEGSIVGSTTPTGHKIDFKLE
jgi:hypothetical protein